jgi:soluble lytic murein transglycosylase
MRKALLNFIIVSSIVVIVFATITHFAFPLRHKEAITSTTKAHDIDPVLVASVIRAESNFNQNAVSPKGAQGLMQIMPSTAAFVAKMHDIEEYDLFDPHDNILLGTLYLKYLFKYFHDTKTVLMAYNAGEGNVSKWLRANETDTLTTTPFPETNAYTEKVQNAKNFYRLRFKFVQ